MRQTVSALGLLDLFVGPRPEDGVWEVGVYEHSRGEATVVVLPVGGVPWHHCYAGTPAECFALLRGVLALVETGAVGSLPEAFHAAWRQQINPHGRTWMERLAAPSPEKSS